MVINPFIISEKNAHAYEPSHRNVGLELSLWKRHLEWTFLPGDAVQTGRHGHIRRAAFLCGAFRDRRGQLNVLWTTAAGCHSRLGVAHSGRVRVLVEAVSEVH